MPEEKGFAGISTFGLHIFAMLFMLLDHMWATVIPDNMWLTCVGRLAFPIFAFMLAEGFCLTHSRKNYLKRLVIFAFISEIPFNLMVGGILFYPYHQNVIWTFVIAFACLSGIEKADGQENIYIRAGLTAAVILIGSLAGTIFMVDYLGAGVLTVIIFYMFRGDGWRQRLCQLVGLCWINFVLLAGMTIEITVFGRSFDFPEQGFAVFALILIWMYKGRQGLHSRALQLAFYAFYPVHMLVLSLLALS